MSMLRRLFDVKILVLCLTVFNGWAFATSALVTAAPPGKTLGDCWQIDPITKMPVLRLTAKDPNNNCALTANTCKTIGDCTTEPQSPWVKWTSSIKIGDCSTAVEAGSGTCQQCQANLTCAIGDKYADSAACNLAPNSTSTGKLAIAVANNNCAS